jgi:hypothetical protein
MFYRYVNSVPVPSMVRRINLGMMDGSKRVCTHIKQRLYSVDAANGNGECEGCTGDIDAKLKLLIAMLVIPKNP